MEKREVKKPRLFLSVILPIVLFEILFILASVLSLVFLKDNLTANIGIAVAIIIIFGCIFLLVFLVSILIYLFRYASYEKSLYPNGKFSIPAVIGFIVVAAGYLLNLLVSWIPLVGLVMSIFLAFVIIGGAITSIVALSMFKQGEKGKGLANIGAFMGIYYVVHLIISIILIIILWIVVASFISSPGLID